MNLETWKPVPDTDGLYQVSDHGRIRATFESKGRPSGRILKPYHKKYGHTGIVMFFRGNIFRRQVHRLVLEAFLGPCPNGMECRHMDGNARNNHISNLEWGTRLDNIRDKARHGTQTMGSGQHLSKLSEGKIPEIRNRISSGETLTKIALDFGVSVTAIWCISKNKTWRQVR